MKRLLVIDDEPSICWGLTQVAEGLGLAVSTAASAEQGLDLADELTPDMVILDVRLPGMDGLTAMGKLREKIGDAPIIVITAHGDLETAVQAVRHSAFEYLNKPFDLAQVEHVLRRAEASLVAPKRRRQAKERLGDLVGNSAPMQVAYKQIALAAGSDASVLLQGESGTGKELAARAIHQYSARGSGPLVSVNVASLSSSLAESELFGHVRGAFTGAEHSSDGLLVKADGGTLFLDEVADIPLDVQVKLLRALEYGEVLPIGAGVPVKTNFRIISATHQNLLQQVEAGAFRHDLYFRIAALQVTMPPLRERPEDIEDLVDHLLAKICDAGPLPLLSPAAQSELHARRWMGNVRELQNAIEHAVIAARGGTIEPAHLPPTHDINMARRAGAAADQKTQDEDAQDEDAQDENALDRALAELVRRWTEGALRDNEDASNLYDELLKRVEPAMLRAALEKHQGQYAAAARRLGIHRTTLRKKLEQYDADGQDNGTAAK